MTDGEPPNDRGCRACGKIGHLVRDCPRKKASDENKKKHQQLKRQQQQRLQQETKQKFQQLKEQIASKKQQTPPEEEGRTPAQPQQLQPVASKAPQPEHGEVSETKGKQASNSSRNKKWVRRQNALARNLSKDMDLKMLVHYYSVDSKGVITERPVVVENSLSAPAKEIRRKNRKKFKDAKKYKSGIVSRDGAGDTDTKKCNKKSKKQTKLVSSVKKRLAT